MKNLIRKLFLVKEIKSKEGVLHFQRYRFFQSKKFAIYLHFIAKSDEDKHPHNHPWNFVSIILKGGYIESLWKYDTVYNVSGIPNCHYNGYFITKYVRKLWKNFIAIRDAESYHKIELLAPTWTLVFTGPRRLDEWGYLTESGFQNHIEYRKNKNEHRIS